MKDVKWECQICDIGESIGVASSSLGPLSQTYCAPCAALRAEPLYLLEGMDEDCGGNLRPEFFKIWTFYKGQYLRYEELR